MAGRVGGFRGWSRSWGRRRSLVLVLVLVPLLEQVRLSWPAL